jgi:hypothetical protein
MKLRLIYLKMMVSLLVQNNSVIAELPKEGSCGVDIEPRTPQFGALFVRPPRPMSWPLSRIGRWADVASANALSAGVVGSFTELMKRRR